MYKTTKPKLLVATIAIIASIPLTTGIALADQTTISATISPVRIVTLDQGRNIIKVESNTAESITPTAVLASDDTPTSLSPDEISKYDAIINSVPAGKYGVVYQSMDNTTSPDRSLLVQILGLPQAAISAVSNFIASLT